jgi:tetratricopeptide (TPR) repeat protein
MGRRANPKLPTPQPEVLRRCQDLLRHLAHPRRLRENPLAQRLWACAGLALEGSPEPELTKCLELAVRSSLARVSHRQRIVIERCDLLGESSWYVAEELHISRRHLYRERAIALAAIACHLEDAARLDGHAAALLPDAFGVQMALARRLEQNGHWTIAAETLEQLASVLDDAAKRCVVESRLANLYTEVDRYSLADEHVRRAFELGARAEGLRWVRAEAVLAAAQLTVAIGDYSTAQSVAQRCCFELRNEANSESRSAETLLNALNLRSKIAIGHGDARTAREVTAEASSLARHLPNADIGELVAARVFDAMARIISGTPATAEADLWNCYRFATDAGHTRDAVSVALVLSGYLRLMGRSKESLALLRPLLNVARDVGGAGDVFGGVLIELGCASVDVGEPAFAATCLKELLGLQGRSVWIQAYAALLEAQVQLANQRFDASLKASEAAETAFIRLDRERFVGPSLQLQAEALAALGETRRALRTMRLAVTKIEATGQHYRRLARAYLAVGSLTGDSALKRKAHNMLTAAQ